MPPMKRRYKIERAGKRWKVVEITSFGRRIEIRITMTWVKSRLEAKAFIAGH
jgi:hypothetical protein